MVCAAAASPGLGLGPVLGTRPGVQTADLLAPKIPLLA